MHFCHLSEDTNHKMAVCGRDEPQRLLGGAFPKLLVRGDDKTTVITCDSTVRTQDHV